MDLSNLEYFCLFIGHPRNGSSILGGLLDAHRNIVISHELNVLLGVKNKRKVPLFQSIYNNAHMNSKKGRIQSGYKCGVPDAWQGRDDGIRIIGDKKADWTASLLFEDPQRLDALKELVELPVKFIHTIRNPFDTIATIARKKEKHKDYTMTTGGSKNMKNGIIGYYFDVILKGVEQTKNKTLKEDWIEVYNEDLIARPKLELKKIVEFFGLKADKDYLNKCAKVVRRKPHKTRIGYNWKKPHIKEILRRMEKYSYLHRYTFED